MAKTTCKTIKTQIYRYKTILIHIERYKTCLCVTVSQRQSARLHGYCNFSHCIYNKTKYDIKHHCLFSFSFKHTLQ